MDCSSWKTCEKTPISFHFYSIWVVGPGKVFLLASQPFSADICFFSDSAHDSNLISQVFHLLWGHHLCREMELIDEYSVSSIDCFYLLPKMPSLTQIISVPGFCNMETSWYDFSDVCSSILWFCLFYLIIFCSFCLYWIIIATIFFSFSNQIFSLLNKIIAFHNFLSRNVLLQDPHQGCFLFFLLAKKLHCAKEILVLQTT